MSSYAYRRWIAGLAIATVGVSLVFFLFPGLDLSASAAFWTGGGFMLDKTGIGRWFTVYLHAGMRAIFFAYMGLAGLALGLRRFQKHIRWRDYLFIVLSVALAAGLLTNVVLKDHWGRARPNQIVEFGGTQTFTPDWVISNQCDSNCSFVGGDVSFAFCGLAAALCTVRRRKAWVTVSITFGCLVGFGRIAAGAHFLSDCIIAGLLTSLVILALYRALYRVSQR